jgi:hypothetical protein
MNATAFAAVGIRRVVDRVVGGVVAGRLHLRGNFVYECARGVFEAGVADAAGCVHHHAIAGWTCPGVQHDTPAAAVLVHLEVVKARPVHRRRAFATWRRK